MKFLQTAGLVFVVAVCSGLFGAGVGFVLGNALPGYYRTVFPRMVGSPEELGIGLGFTQGLMLGSVLGVAVALIVAWRERGAAQRAGAEDLAEEVRELRRVVLALRSREEQPPASQQVRAAQKS
jgi:hypothetical protein